MDRDLNKNITDKDMQQQRGSQQTMQRPKTERGDIYNPEIDDDAMVDETTRSQIGAGE